MASQFSEIIMDPTKDVFTVFYKLDHDSELMADDYQNLALEYANRTDVIISEVDMNLNQIPGYTFDKSPTLMWFPKNNKSGLTYKGEREYLAIAKFIEEYRKRRDGNNEKRKEKMNQYKA